MSKQTYSQAIKAPTAKNGKGWANASASSMQAALSQALGLTFCLNPEAIFDWANRHGVNLTDRRKQLSETADLLLVAVLNDWDLETTERNLKE